MSTVSSGDLGVRSTLFLRIGTLNNDDDDDI